MTFRLLDLDLGVCAACTRVWHMWHRVERIHREQQPTHYVPCALVPSLPLGCVTADRAR